MWNKIKSKPILKNILFASLTVLCVIFITLFWLRSYTNHGEKIETPNFLGMTMEDAQELAKEKNIRLKVDTVFSDKPKNTIILQSPPPFSDSLESWVKSERIIYLSLVSHKTQRVQLPDIIYKSKSHASTKLTIVGLNPEWKKRASPYKDVVLEVKYENKTIKKGYYLPKKSKVTVFIGGGKNSGAQVKIPNLTGKTINEANITLADKSFSLVPIYNGCKTKEDSTQATITIQDPEFVEGKTISEGSDIVVTLDKQ